MQVRTLLAAVLLAATAAGAMAQEIDPRDQHIAAAAQSLRTREAVKAEVRNTREAGQWQPAGELNAAVAVPVVGSPAVALSRQDVRTQVAAARAAHQLPRAGELM